MLLRLPEENKDFIKGLFRKRQPNNSALWTYLNGDIRGETYVDNLTAPTKAVCVIFWGWGFVSDDADLEWIESVIQDICEKNQVTIIWNSADRPQKPAKGLEMSIPRLDFIERKEASTKPLDVELKFLNEKLFDKCEWKEMQLWLYSTPEHFLEKAFGACALENDKICCEAYATFQAKGSTEIGVITAESKLKKGLGYATCLKVIEEAAKRGLKVTWSCDQENEASVRLAEKLCFCNPIPYEFLYFPKKQ